MPDCASINGFHCPDNTFRLNALRHSLDSRTNRRSNHPPVERAVDRTPPHHNPIMCVANCCLLSIWFCSLPIEGGRSARPQTPHQRNRCPRRWRAWAAVAAVSHPPACSLARWSKRCAELHDLSCEHAGREIGFC